MDMFPETYIYVVMHIYIWVCIYMNNGHMRDSASLIIKDMPITKK